MADVRVQRVGDVDVVTIDRPEVRNALRFRSYDELERRAIVNPGPFKEVRTKREGLLAKQAVGHHEGNRVEGLAMFLTFGRQGFGPLAQLIQG